MKQRKIIHIDMDAFYASVEQRDRPELRGKPVVVGGDPQGRGVVAAASYEAQKFGVRSAMSSAKAQRLCPKAVFVRPNFEKYCAASEQIQELFLEITPLVEPLSLDEAYLDVTDNLLGEPLARKIAADLKAKIRRETGLTASAGVAPNKFIAKVASDLRKPDGLVVVPPEKVAEFVNTLPVEKFWGVGPATAAKLHEMGIFTAKDVRARSLSELERELGKFGEFLLELAHGRDDRPVEPEREAKSRGTEETFETDVHDREEMLAVLNAQSHEISDELRETGKEGKTLTIKIRYADFKTVSRQRTLDRPISSAQTIFDLGARLLHEALDQEDRPIRLLGLSISGFSHPGVPEQLWLDFPPPFHI